MKRMLLTLLCASLAASCGSDAEREQKITIRVEVPEDKPSDAMLPANPETDNQKNLPDLVKEVMSRLDDLQPIIENVMLDDECRALVRKGDSGAFAEYLSKNHSESVSDIADILGVQDNNVASRAVANHMIRKGKGKRRPFRDRRQ